jgi:hypothetical protein
MFRRGLLRHLRNVPKSVSPKNIGEYIDKHTIKPNSDLSVKQPDILDSIKKYVGYPRKSPIKSDSIDYPNVPIILLIIGILGILGVIGFSLYEGNVFEGFRNNKHMKQKKHKFNNMRIIILLFLLVLLCALFIHQK